MPDKEGSDDEKTTKGVVNKKQKQMLNQEYIPETQQKKVMSSGQGLTNYQSIAQRQAAQKDVETDARQRVRSTTTTTGAGGKFKSMEISDGGSVGKFQSDIINKLSPMAGAKLKMDAGGLVPDLGKFAQDFGKGNNITDDEVLQINQEVPGTDAYRLKTMAMIVNKNTKREEYIPEEEYDHYRDRILMRGGDHRSKETRERSNTPSSDSKRKGDTPMQKEFKKKYGKKATALDAVKADITAKYGKGAIMKVGKKKVKEELDLTKIAEAFGGYLLEKKSPEELAAEMKKRREEKFPKKTKPLSKFERARQDFDKDRKNIELGDVDSRMNPIEGEFDTERDSTPTPTQQKKGAKVKGKIKLGDTTVGGPIKNIKGEPKKVGTSTRGDRAKERTLLKQIERQTPNVEKPLPQDPDIDDFIRTGPQAEIPFDKTFKVNPKGRKKDRSGKYFAKPARKGSDTEAEAKAKIKPTPNVRFAAPAGSGLPVVGQVKEPTDKQRRARYKKDFDKAYTDFTTTGGVTAAKGGVLPGGKGQADQSDAAQEFNKQQNILRRLQRQGMADSGATPFKQPPLPEVDPSKRPKSDIPFSQFQKNQRLAQNKRDAEAADAYKQTPEYKLQTQQVDPNTGQLLSKDELKRKFQMQRQGNKQQIDKETPKDQGKVDLNRDSLKSGIGGFERGRQGTLTRRGSDPRNEKSPNVETMPEKIGRKAKTMMDKTQTGQMSYLGALGGILTKGVSSSAAGAEAGMRYARGDKGGAALSALQGLGGGVGFAAGVANAIRSVRIARGGKTAGLAKVVPPEELAMAAATGGAVIPQLKGVADKLRGAVGGISIKGGRAGTRSAAR